MDSSGVGWGKGGACVCVCVCVWGGGVKWGLRSSLLRSLKTKGADGVGCGRENGMERERIRGRRSRDGRLVRRLSFLSLALSLSLFLQFSRLSALFVYQVRTAKQTSVHRRSLYLSTNHTHTHTHTHTQRESAGSSEPKKERCPGGAGGGAARCHPYTLRLLHFTLVTDIATAQVLTSITRASFSH